MKFINKLIRFFSFSVSLLFCTLSFGQQVDYSVVSVPEESGSNFKMISTDNDFVYMPEVIRKKNSIQWQSSKVISECFDGEKIAFISARGLTRNIFIKDVNKKTAVVQRTSRKSICDFSFSPDGKNLVFSENSMKTNVIFQTDASVGFVCRQISSGYNDYSPVYSNDNSKIFFARQEGNAYSIWSYDIKANFLTNYTPGMNPVPIPEDDAFICVKVNGYSQGEIWKVNYITGVEECIVADAEKSFSTPSVSPDGQWILFVGSSAIPYGRGLYRNTDIYACRTDGTQLTQLTYHAADDLSPTWSNDGQFIYFVSQRGSSAGMPNIWRMSFNF